MAKKLYVGNLTYDTTEDNLVELFSEYGEVLSAQIIIDRDTNRSKGFGFVEMSDGADEAANALNGQDFRGRQLAIVSTAFGMAYSAGSVVGATPLGYLIDLFGPEALPISIAVGFLGLTAFLLRRVPETDAQAAEEFVILPGVDNLPDIKFDLSFLFEQPAAAPGMGDPEHEWQERSLEEWFRRRATEVARLALDRHQTALEAFQPAHHAG